tara:strand:- start:562 stop:747 length:186 start_codon:yes stop_codon:yes gene_type:complete
MTLGKIFLKAIATGIILDIEFDWIVINQLSFSKSEKIKSLFLGDLIDRGKINLACRLLVNG